jgi:aldoxime dehydratase
MTTSAIPAHLRVQRSVPPTRNPPDGHSDFASFSHFLPESVTTLSVAYIGVQSATADWAQLADLLRVVDCGLQAEGGSDHHDRARYVDSAGFKTILIAAYWLQPSDFDRWWRHSGQDWVDPEMHSDGCGRFVESLQPTVERLETIVSSADGREGFGALADGTSPPIAEHGYWGSMRDRLPIAQVDTLAPGRLGPVVYHADDRVISVRLDANACVIRSGQDYSDTQGDERTYYLEYVEPRLRRGMDFLRAEGSTIGCYVNRYLQVLDDEFVPIEKSYAVSWWVDVAALEAWARSHPTHVAIFDSFMQHMSRFGQDAQLRLYHEVMVPDPHQQVFRYLDCHNGTGVLPAALASRAP